MKDALGHATEIRRRIGKAGGAVVLLDFDGTLAPIVSEPGKARMNARMRRALEACARRFPVAIVTGRALADVRKRVRVLGVSFAGNHGFEWSIRGKSGVVPIAPRLVRALAKVKEQLVMLATRYKGAFVEDKKHSLAVHYRRVHQSLRGAFVRGAQTVVQDRGGKHLRVVPGILLLNILPNVGWNKGEAARMMHARLRTSKTSVPIFIGDDKTDEDAFRALRQGITVHVKNGKRMQTAARYALKDTKAVQKFLLLLAEF